MNLNIVDIIIILIIGLGAIVGFKEGVIKKTVSILGLVLVIVISFILKNHLSTPLMKSSKIVQDYNIGLI